MKVQHILRSDAIEPSHCLAYAKPAPQTNGLTVSVMFNQQMHKIFINVHLFFITPTFLYLKCNHQVALCMLQVKL
jgi:hypothetical protein